jgi:SAM-dependent methyltransferase
MIEIRDYLLGKRLYGDDFDQSQIEAWFADEKEGYATLGSKDAASYKYSYHAWNEYHAFRHLRGTFPHVMGFGSAYGEEMLPIIERIQRLTIVDPSDTFERRELNGVPIDYTRADPTGKIAAPDDSFDLIVCLGVLHHIPNVSFVVTELFRTLKPGGCLIVREPIISLGDWRKPRKQLTKRERGIPLRVFRDIVGNAGFSITRESLCGLPGFSRLFNWLRPDVYNSPFLSRTDALIAKSLAWNVNYHPRNKLQKLRPTSAFMLLSKGETNHPP